MSLASFDRRRDDPGAPASRALRAAAELINLRIK
jgi:hypothetical protein